MSHYCARCYHWADNLDLITFWCTDCTTFWREAIQSARRPMT